MLTWTEAKSKTQETRLEGRSFKRELEKSYRAGRQVQLCVHSGRNGNDLEEMKE